jgi:hypothetical protein
MRAVYLGECAGSAMHSQGGRATRPAAHWLGLAAAPTFATMALLTSVSAGPTDILCGAASPLGGMTAMYLLMSAFHSAPWLNLIAGRRG